MRSLLVLAILVAGVAHAHAPGDAVWITADVDARRFLDDPTPGPSFDASGQVTVLTTVGEQVRVFSGDQFGWVPTSALTTTPPAGVIDGLPPSPAPTTIQLTPTGAP